MKVTIEDLCKGLIPTTKQKNNLSKLVFALNVLFSIISFDYKIVAGLLTPDGAEAKEEDPNGPLTTGEAVLIEDKDFTLTRYLLNNLELLEREGLYLRNPAMTVSKTLTQQYNKKSYMTNYILLQTKHADSTIFNER